MPLIDYVQQYGPQVGAVLRPRERLIDMSLYHEPLVGDDSRLERTLDELPGKLRELTVQRGETPTLPDRLVTGFDPLRGGVQTNPRWIDRVLGGRSGEGSPGSAAGRLWRAAKAPADTAFYAVTDLRLLLLTARGIGASRTFQIVFDLPRSQVSGAARRGRLLQRGRVEVRFADGSMKAWTTGVLSTGRARSLVTALTSATPAMEA